MTESVYTKVVVADIVERYEDAVGRGADYDARRAVVLELAAELDVSEESVRGKLVAERVYVGKPKVGSDTTSTSKEAYAKALSAIVGKDVGSLSKGTKADLKAVVDYITQASACRSADEGVDEVKVLQAQV